MKLQFFAMTLLAVALSVVGMFCSRSTITAASPTAKQSPLSIRFSDRTAAAAVSSLTLTIEGSNFSPMTHTLFMNGFFGFVLEDTFEIPVGPSRTITALARDGAGTVLYKGVTTLDITEGTDELPVDLWMYMTTARNGLMFCFLSGIFDVQASLYCMSVPYSVPYYIKVNSDTLFKQNDPVERSTRIGRDSDNRYRFKADFGYDSACGTVSVPIGNMNFSRRPLGDTLVTGTALTFTWDSVGAVFFFVSIDFIDSYGIRSQRDTVVYSADIDLGTVSEDGFMSVSVFPINGPRPEQVTANINGVVPGILAAAGQSVSAQFVVGNPYKNFKSLAKTYLNQQNDLRARLAQYYAAKQAAVPSVPGASGTSFYVDAKVVHKYANSRSPVDSLIGVILSIPIIRPDSITITPLGLNQSAPQKITSIFSIGVFGIGFSAQISQMSYNYTLKIFKGLEICSATVAMPPAISAPSDSILFYTNHDLLPLSWNRPADSISDWSGYTVAVSAREMTYSQVGVRCVVNDTLIAASDTQRVLPGTLFTKNATYRFVITPMGGQPYGYSRLPAGNIKGFGSGYFYSVNEAGSDTVVATVRLPMNSSINHFQSTPDGLPELWPEVYLYLSVRDSLGRAISGLNNSSFKIYENGVEQSVQTCAHAGGNIAIALNLDYSGSMAANDITFMQDAAHSFINSMGVYDRSAIVKFASTVEVTKDFSGDRDSLHAAIDSTTIDAGSTALYDAIYTALQLCVNEQGKRSVLAMTDGGENSSTHTLQEILNFSLANNIPINTVGLGGSCDQIGLKQIADSTGGYFYYASSSSGLIDLYQEISVALQNYYILSYTSSKPVADGTTRVVRVQSTAGTQNSSVIRSYKAPLTAVQ